MESPNRRDFPKSAAGAALAGAPVPADTLRPPNDRIRVAVIGLRGRGRSHIAAFHQQAPQVHTVMYEYAGHDALLTFETRSGWTNTEAGMGAEYPFLDKRKVGAGDITDLPHCANFIQAVRSRKLGDFTAEARELHLSAALPHVANIAYRTGRMLRFDPETERFAGDEEANRLLTREYRAPYVVA